jgi:hypothetical protein
MSEKEIGKDEAEDTQDDTEGQARKRGLAPEGIEDTQDDTEGQGRRLAPEDTEDDVEGQRRV